MKSTNCALLLALLIPIPAYSQTAEMQAIAGAAEALGGRSRIEGVRSIIMEVRGGSRTSGKT